MQLDQISASVVIGLLGFFGALLGVIVSNLVAARLASQERREIRRKEQLKRLTDMTDALVKVRAQLQWLQSEVDPAKREVAYGEAYAVMLTTGDVEIVELAEVVMKGEGHGGSLNEKIEAINSALRKLGHLIKEMADKE